MDTTGAPDTPPASAGPEPPPRPNPFAALEQPQDLEAVPEEDEFVDAVNEDEPVDYDMRNEAKEPADIMSKLNGIKVELETKEDRRDIQFYFLQLAVNPHNLCEFFNHAEKIGTLHVHMH